MRATSNYIIPRAIWRGYICSLLSGRKVIKNQWQSYWLLEDRVVYNHMLSINLLWLKFLAEVSFFLSQPLDGSNFRTTCLIWMNNLSLEIYYVVVFKYYVFDHISCDIFARACNFSSISGKIHHVASFNPIQLYLMTINVISVCRSLKKLKTEGWNLFRGSVVQKLEKKCFSVKIWIIIKKICLYQQKINGNNVITF